MPSLTEVQIKNVKMVETKENVVSLYLVLEDDSEYKFSLKLDRAKGGNVTASFTSA